MSRTFSNPCTRCGTERIISRTWKEKIGDSTVTNTETICPNPQCQKKVDMDNKKQKDKYTAMKLQSAQRAVSRRAIGHAKMVKNKKNKRRTSLF